MKLTDMVMEPVKPHRPRIIYERVMAWRPVISMDEGMVWLRPVWSIKVDGLIVGFSRSILPIGEAVKLAK